MNTQIENNSNLNEIKSVDLKTSDLIAQVLEGQQKVLNKQADMILHLQKVVNNHAEVITSLRKNADITNENIQTINKVGESLPEVYKSVAEIYEMTKSKSKPLTFWQWLGF
jgi:hypothetical protein